MSFANRYNPIFFFPIWITFTLFSSLVAISRTFITMSDSSENGCFYLIPLIKSESFSLSPLSSTHQILDAEKWSPLQNPFWFPFPALFIVLITFRYTICFKLFFCLFYSLFPAPAPACLLPNVSAISASTFVSFGHSFIKNSEHAGHTVAPNTYL